MVNNLDHTNIYFVVWYDRSILPADARARSRVVCRSSTHTTQSMRTWVPNDALCVLVAQWHPTPMKRISRHYERGNENVI